MHSAFFTILALVAATAFAQSLDGLPSCAKACVGNGLASTGCNAIDIGCICASKGWITQLSCCIANTCSQADQEATIQFADKLCATKGITTLPTVAGCSATSSDASAGSPSSTGGSSSRATTSAAGSTAAASTSKSSGTGTSAGSTSTAGASGATGATGSSSAQSGSASAASSSSSGAGSENTHMGFGLAVAGLIAAVL